MVEPDSKVRRLDRRGTATWGGFSSHAGELATDGIHGFQSSECEFTGLYFVVEFTCRDSLSFCFERRRGVDTRTTN